jgi:hypothetical protein
VVDETTAEHPNEAAATPNITARSHHRATPVFDLRTSVKVLLVTAVCN